MSSYLTFYLVPKKTKTRYWHDENGSHEEEIEISKGHPLSIMSFSRNNEVYQAYNETLNPVYAGIEDKYTELTVADAERVVSEYEQEVKSTEKRLEITYKMLKNGGSCESLWGDIHETERYLDEQKHALSELKHLAGFVYEVTNSCTDIEKVLINID